MGVCQRALKIEVDKLLVTLNEDFTTVDLGVLSFFTGCAVCLLYTSPSPRDQRGSRMPSSA